MSEIETFILGEESISIWSKGHVDIDEFVCQCERVHRISVLRPVHCYARKMPCKDGEYQYFLRVEQEKGRGAFPITITNESYGIDSYVPIPKPPTESR